MWRPQALDTGVGYPPAVRPVFVFPVCGCRARVYRLDDLGLVIAIGPLPSTLTQPLPIRPGSSRIVRLP